jgi:TonB-linked SusC/RagA family outer membrane protein
MRGGTASSSGSEPNYFYCYPGFVSGKQTIVNTQNWNKSMLFNAFCCPARRLPGFTTKLLRVMKLTAFLLIAFALHISAKTYSQSITYSGKTVLLETVFGVIEKQTGYVVFYDYRQITGAKSVTLDVKDEPLISFLGLCFKNQPFGYAIEDKTIVITKHQPPALAGGLSTSLTRPSTPIYGRVLDADGAPLAGATVTLRGSKVLGVTNAEGVFSVNVSVGDVLVISSVGFESIDYTISSAVVASSDQQSTPGTGMSLTIMLKRNESKLDEVQIVAYGTTTQRFNLGNVTSIKAKDIDRQPVTNPLLALEGRVPGLYIIQNSGISRGPVTVKIQGQNSLYNGNEPLYIVDGVPYPGHFNSNFIDGPFSDNGSSPLSYLNPADIQSIDVLKDADATAIYGSRAANGAILITTKKGKIGALKLDVNVQQGWGKVNHMVKMMNTRQYLDMRYEAFRNDGIDWRDPSVSARDLKVWDTTRYTDWQKTLIGGTAQYSNINIGVSGGTATVQYTLGGTWHRETSVFPGDFADKTGSLHFNLNTVSVNQKLHLQLSTNYLADVNRLPGYDLTAYAIKFAPDAPALYDTNGKINWETDANGSATWINPIADQALIGYKNKVNNLTGSLSLSYSIIKGLDLKCNGGYNVIQTNTSSLTPLDAIRPQDRLFTPRSSYFATRDLRSYSIEPQLVFNKLISGGKLEALVGTSIQQSNTVSSGVGASGFNSDLLLEDIKSAANVFALSSENTTYKYNAVFARVNYNLFDKYIIGATVRRDGSSRFGEKNRFHNFGSLAAGWIFSQERLFQKKAPFLSFGKLKMSYGTTGSDQIGDYSFQSNYYASYAEVSYQNMSGLTQGSLSNPYLQWEETRKWQWGLDLGFLQDRILINAVYSLNRSSNQLLSQSLPSITGFDGFQQNRPATVQNTSFEFTLNADIIRGAFFTWTSSINLTIPRNKLIAYPDLASSADNNSLFIGRPIGTELVFHFRGVDPATGVYQVETKDGGVTFSPDYYSDRKVYITKLPRFYGGFQNNITYKGFELDFLLQFVKQTGSNDFRYNASGFSPGSFLSTAGNQPADLVNRWQKPGDQSGTQRLTTELFAQNNATQSDANYTDASFVRLKNASLSWKLPAEWQQKAHLQNTRLFIRGQNLLTYTKYKGPDPENQNGGVLPPLKVLTVGVQISI